VTAGVIIPNDEDFWPVNNVYSILGIEINYIETYEVFYVYLHNVGANSKISFMLTYVDE